MNGRGHARSIFRRLTAFLWDALHQFTFMYASKKMPFSLTNELQQLSAEAREAAMEKVDMVRAAQRARGMEPRDDSRLTYTYAMSDGTELPSVIADELVMVDKIYQTTPYGRILEEVLREIANFVRSKYRLSWIDTWEVTRFYGPTMLKLYCLKRT